MMDLEMLDEIWATWSHYADRLNEGDGEEGSLIGAAYIIARSAVSTIPLLITALREARERADRAENELRRLVGWKFQEGPNA